MKKKILYTILIVAILIWLLQLFIGFPLVIVQSEVFYNETIFDSLKKGDLISPLAKVNFSNENCSVYILVVTDDLKELPSNVLHKKLIRIGDLETLKEFKNEFNFSYSGGDMATCESSIYILCDNKLIFESKILISNERVGLQNQYGWIEAIEPNKLIELIGKAKPVYSPIVFL